jgi:hypothetical protein
MSRRPRLWLALVLVAISVALATHFVRIGTQDPWTDGAMIATFNKPVQPGHMEPAFGIIAGREYKRRDAALAGIVLPAVLTGVAGVLALGFRPRA